MDEVMHRIPLMEKAEIRQMINGPESFTPDLRAIMGEAPQVIDVPIGSGVHWGFPQLEVKGLWKFHRDQSIVYIPLTTSNSEIKALYTFH